jgi:hypothetical protein
MSSTTAVGADELLVKKDALLEEDELEELLEEDELLLDEELLDELLRKRDDERPAVDDSPTSAQDTYTSSQW